MNEFVYRLRPIATLFEREELERQEIYFASLDQLNDPMEGFQDIFWDGDEILWTALLKNYLLCLYHVYVLIRLGVEPTDSDIFVFNNETRFPTQAYKDKVTKLYENFFEDGSVARFVNNMSRRGPIGRDELCFYLKSIHHHCISAIPMVDDPKPDADKESPEKERIPLSSPGDILDTKFFEALKAAPAEIPEVSDLAEAAFEILRHMQVQTELDSILRNPDLRESLAKRFYFVEFPQRYIKRLERLMYPNWYTACFFDDPTNPATWGYYTRDHSGVCLKFRTTERERRKGFHLYGVNGLSSANTESGFKKLYGNRFFALSRVEYGTAYPKIDFFRSIGRLPFPQLLKHWYSDKNGTVSARVQDIMGSHETWRKSYWHTFVQNTSIKLSEWKHEGETRLHLSGVLDDEIVKEDRKLMYDFSALEGIVFGIKTSTEDKLRIIDIIDRKCSKEGRTDFTFYQASYSSRSGKMLVTPLPLLLKSKLSSTNDS